MVENMRWIRKNVIFYFVNMTCCLFSHLVVKIEGPITMGIQKLIALLTETGYLCFDTSLLEGFLRSCDM